MKNALQTAAHCLIVPLAISLFSATPGLAQSPNTAHLWVDTNGGTCTRNATPAAYNDSSACASMQAAYAVAANNDTVRVKAGTYTGNQNPGGTKTVTFIGEDGAVINPGNAHRVGLEFDGNVTVDNVDVGGGFPIVNFSGANNTWKNSRMLAGTGIRTCTNGDPEPIMIYSDNTPVTNTTLFNIVVEQQKGAQGNAASGCGGDGNYHLELIRIDQNVNGVLIDSVTFESCDDGPGFVGCGSGQIFITTPNGTTFDPTNIVIRNSKFHTTVNFHIQVHNNVQPNNWTFAYNTFGRNEPLLMPSSITSMAMIGNVGTRPQNCTGNVTWTKNVWQWGVGTACGSDTRVNGASFSTSQLGFDSNLRLLASSPAVNAAESAGYCTNTLRRDMDGEARPMGPACDAGADEFTDVFAGPEPPTGLATTVR